MSTFGRRGDAQVDRLIIRTDDPPAEAGKVLVYARAVDGVQRILARFANGTVIIIL